MSRKAKGLGFLVSILLVVVLLPGCGGQPAAKPGGNTEPAPITRRYVFVSGPTGGTWYPFAAAVSEISMNSIKGLNVTVAEGGGIGNLQTVNAGKDAQFGVANLPQLFDALEGKAQFADSPAKNLKAMIVTETNFEQFVVKQGADIKSLKDLGTGKFSVHPGAQTLSSEAFFRGLLADLGMTYDSIRAAGGKVSFTSYAEMASAMKDGNCDIFLIGGPAPHPTILELQTSTAFKLLSFPESELQAYCDKNKGFLVRTIPSNTYKGQTEPVTTLGMANVMFTTADMPDDIVYGMVKAIIENRQRLVEVNQTYNFICLENAIAGLPESTIHPGALKYYKEVGVATK